ncbi:MAG: hypothetical protein NXH84_17410 [Rhodobacteraceae bacterium]|nr:hypothetical protein [Paracoccaceae bacterium]
MNANVILNGLERSDATGTEADSMARLGFLEWVFTQPGEATPEAAQDALRQAELQNPSSAAARAFVAILEEATVPMKPGTRRGRVRVMH